MNIQQLPAQNIAKFRINYANGESKGMDASKLNFTKNADADQYSLTSDSSFNYQSDFDISKIKSITRDRDNYISALSGNSLNKEIRDNIVSGGNIDDIIDKLKSNVNVEDAYRDSNYNIFVLEKDDSVLTVIPTVDYEDPFNNNNKPNLSRGSENTTRAWKETGENGVVAVFNYFSGMSNRQGQNGMVEDLMSLLNSHNYGIEYYESEEFTKKNIENVLRKSRENDAYRAILIFSHGFINNEKGLDYGYQKDPWIVLGESYTSEHGLKKVENESYRWYNFESKYNATFSVNDINVHKNCLLYIGACDALKYYTTGRKKCPIIGWDGPNVLSQAHALMLFHRILNNRLSINDALKSTWGYDMVLYSESSKVAYVVSDNLNGVYLPANSDYSYSYPFGGNISEVYLEEPGYDKVFFRRGTLIDLYDCYSYHLKGNVKYSGDRPSKVWLRLLPVGKMGTGIKSKIKIKKDGSFDFNCKLPNDMEGMYDIIMGEKEDFTKKELVNLSRCCTFVYSSKFNENSANTMDIFTPEPLNITDDNNSSVSAFTLRKGDSKILYINDDEDGPYVVASSDPNVAKVSISGTILTIDAIQSGSTIVTVTDEGGYYKSTIEIAVEDVQKDSNIETFYINGVAFDLIKVDGGDFILGFNGYDESDNYNVYHQVTLSTYYIGKFEVTQKQWMAVMGDNPSYFVDENLPVNDVSWDDCIKFIAEINKVAPVRFRLPTEAEWLYAAWGGKNNERSLGADPNYIDEVAWHVSNSDDRIHEVGLKAPNSLGIFDMFGNVSEWCYDWFGPYPAEAVVNPTGPQTGEYRIVLGGSFRHWGSQCWQRDGDSPEKKRTHHGFRLAIDNFK